MTELLRKFYPYESTSWIIKTISYHPILFILTIVFGVYFYYFFKRKADQGELMVSMSVANVLAISGIVLIIIVGL